MDTPQRLLGRSALVTGGSRGFGRATAIRLASEGADVAICYRGAADAAAEVKAAVEGHGRKAIVVQADVADPEQARQAVRTATAEFDGLDILVNNAGVRNISLFADEDPSEWRRVIDINVWGTMSAMQEALKGMIAARGGCIVNITSQLAHVGMEKFAVYSGTKAFLLALTKSVAREVGQFGITANAVCPGSIVTDMNRASAARAGKDHLQSIPLRRQGDPDDVAAAVAYLASGDGSFVTGQCIDVNGGYITA